MKRSNLPITRWIWVCGTAFALTVLGGQVLAADKQKAKKAKASPTCQAAQPGCCAKDADKGAFEKVTITTGTHLNDKTKKRGEMTYGRNAVVVLDQNAMRRTGASTVQQVLAGHSTMW